jgi:hypothetical protein
MTISSETTRSGPFSGNGATTVFGYAFKVYDEGDLEVVLADEDGVETVQTISTHYAVSGVGNDGGGNVTMVTAPASGETLTIRRKLELLQPDSLNNQSEVPNETHERRWDELTMMLQQVAEENDRAIRFPVSDSVSLDPELPVAALRANKAMVFDADGNVGVSADDYDDQAANAAASAVAAAASASTASGHATTAGNAATAAEAAQTAAEAAQGLAETAQTAAEAAQTAAETAETNAEAAQAAAEAAAAKLSGTSTSSVAVGTGSKAFTTQSGKFFEAGTWLLLTSDADPANYLHGQVTAYSGTDLAVNVTNVGGSGTHADWTIRVAGTQGATGATGPQGEQGIQGEQGPPGTGDVTGPGSATAGNMATYADGSGSVLSDGGAPHRLKVSADDTTPGHLEDKLLATGLAALATQNDGGNETRTIDVPIASQAEAEAGTDNSKATTSLRVAQAIAALLPLPSQAEAEAGTATTPRSWSAERVAQAIAALAGGGGIAMSTQVFTASGTYTKPSGLLYAWVFVTGGGGAGNNDANQGHGAGGGTAIKLIAAGSIGSTETVTVGAGGAVSAGSGGTSSFGSHCSATGGTGNITTWRVNGGVGSGGDINSAGEYGYYHAGDTDPGGGGSFWGWAGSRGAGSVGPGTAGVVFVLEFKEA